VPDIFDEVQEDLRAEAARRMARRYSGAAAAALVLILGGTGTYVWWQNSEKAAQEAVATQYLAASDEADHAKPGAAAALAVIAQTGPEGYRTLARLRLAALDWQAGRHDQAVAAWQAVADDGSAPALLRDLATLSRLQHQSDTGNPLLLKQQAEALTAPGNPWRPMAEQVIALLDLRAGKPADAVAIMRRLTLDPSASPGVRQMAGDLVQTIDVPPPPPAPAPAQSTPGASRQAATPAPNAAQTPKGPGIH